MPSDGEIFDAVQNMSGGQPAASGNSLFGMSMWGILASLVFSGAGIFYFKLGRSDGDMPLMICGIILIIYPYFVASTLYIVLIGLALLALPWALKRL